MSRLFEGGITTIPLRSWAKVIPVGYRKGGDGRHRSERGREKRGGKKDGKERERSEGSGTFILTVCFHVAEGGPCPLGRTVKRVTGPANREGVIHRYGVLTLIYCNPCNDSA